MRPVVVPAGPSLTAQIRFTDRSDGDLGIDTPPDALAERRRRVHPEHWNWMRQVHGSTVHEADAAGEVAGAEGDVLVTRRHEVPIAVQTADCAPVVLVASGVVAVCHAGWRGLAAGVIDAAVAGVAAEPRSIEAHLGPLIRPSHYEFSSPELDGLVRSLGPAVRSATESGRPAFDLAAGITVALRRSGVERMVDHGWNTAAAEFFSHRVRRETARQSAVAWLEQSLTASRPSEHR